MHLAGRRILLWGARRFSSGVAVGEPNNTDIFSAFDVAPTKMVDFPSWYKSMREKLAQGSGPSWPGGAEQPFPYNPEFRPRAPVTDAFREQVMALWENDPKTWTPRQLSSRFKVSIERICAIIKLKALQRRMEVEGFKVNGKYVSRMETHLSAATPRSPEADFKVAEASKIRPVLRAIPEDTQITPSEAASIIGKKLRAIHEQIDADIHADTPFDPFPKEHVPQNRPELTIRVDPYERGRHRFIFIDTSSTTPQEQQVLVRETSGELRYADEVEGRIELKKLRS